MTVLENWYSVIIWVSDKVKGMGKYYYYGASQISSPSILINMQSWYYSPHFTDDKTEAQWFLNN